MAVLTLGTLVLRGVTFLCNGKAGDVRLGASGVAYPTPASAISMRQPQSDPKPAFPNAGERQEPPVADRVVDAVVGGAGRSHGAGVHSRRSAARSAASTAGASRSWLAGGRAAEAWCLEGRSNRRPHPAVQVSPGVHTRTLGIEAKGQAGTPAGSYPAVRTPPRMATRCR
jgi:hypothetical protein